MFKWDPQKTTQVAGRFLTQNNGGMNDLFLLKLIYCVDREAISRWHRPITGDKYYSMENGPVLSKVYDLVKGEAHDPYWDKYIGRRSYPEFFLTSKEPVPSDKLSIAESELISKIYAQNRHRTKWGIVDITHTFPEWENPEESGRLRIPLEYSAIFRALNFSPEDINLFGENASIAKTLDDLE